MSVFMLVEIGIKDAGLAVVGALLGKGRVVRRGKDISFLAGELFQNDELVATATATVIVRNA
jgi:acyl-coenzyme A thioesterase PaaI-like protein